MGYPKSFAYHFIGVGGVVGLRSMVRTTDHLTDLYCVFLCKLECEGQELVQDDEEVADVSWIPLTELDKDPLVTEYTRKVI
ncbi:MAG: hypothetical protein ACW97Z_08190 [Candidatus Hodarchaeales archaeon]|jgi:hypothetical protein